MRATRLLIANRGEIAVRVARAAADMGLPTVAVYAEDDAASLHVRVADAAHALPGRGPAAYLDMASVIAAANAAGCDAVHPGYGFLAERADFARACAAAGLLFIGPDPDTLDLFGDKARARTAAVAAGVPVLRGIDHAVGLDEAFSFFAALGPEGAMIIKAVAGGGGRGTRVVSDAGAIEAAYARCRSEAMAAFGRDDVYVEEFSPRARHVEVQIVADRAGAVAHLGERECSVQRRFQKVIEIAPAPYLAEELRQAICDAAVRFARGVGYGNLGTFEFLVDVSGRAGVPPFVFIEANARLQVEHTVTEEVTGVDLVQAQIRLAQGATLAELGLDAPGITSARGYAIEMRVNMEVLRPDGSFHPGGGTLTVYEAPNGPGVRTDGFGYAGYRTSGAFDALLAKVIVHSRSPDFSHAAARAARALSEFRLEGVGTNISFLQNILGHADFIAGNLHTRWVDEKLAELAVAVEHRVRFVAATPPANDGFAGARVSSRDPLALFAHDARVKAGQAAEQHAPQPELIGPDGSVGLAAPIQGTIVAINVSVGDAIRQGAQVSVVEAMKMQHVIAAPHSGIVRGVTMAAGDVVREGFPIVFIEPAEVVGGTAAAVEEVDPDTIRPDLQEAYDRHAYTLDENRPEAVARRRARLPHAAREYS